MKNKKNKNKNNNHGNNHQDKNFNNNVEISISSNDLPNALNSENDALDSGYLKKLELLGDLEKQLNIKQENFEKQYQTYLENKKKLMARLIRFRKKKKN